MKQGRIGHDTLEPELGLRVVFCMGAERRWGGYYRKFLILNARHRTFWAEWIGMLIRWHWHERYDPAGNRVAI